MILWQQQQKLQDILQYIQKNAHTDFYRNKYQGIDLEKVEDISQLPLLHRQELVDVHPSKRCHVPSDQVAFVAYTSGTTSGKPLMTYFSEIDDYHIDAAWGVGVSALLIVFPPLNKNFGGTFIQQCRQSPQPVTPVFGDLDNLATSAYLAESTKCDALYATPSLALGLAPYIKEYYDRSKIKLLVISGETIGHTKLQSLHELYPEALIANLYASSEIGQFIMGPTLRMMKDAVPGFRLLPDTVVALELVEGELVVTYELNRAFPLIRYCTGDFFEVSDTLTDTYGDGLPVLQWAGKGGVDVVRLHGLEIRAGSIDDFFSTIPQKVSSYQLHIFPGKEQVSLQFVLECVLDEPSDIAAELIRDAFIASFKVSNVSTVGHMLQTDLLESCEVSIVSEVSHQAKKRRVLVNHVV